MRPIAKPLLLILAAILTVAVTRHVVHSHCEIPCGIYGDKTRIALLLEDIQTIEKSMTQIAELQKESPANYNQIVRWVNNKEEHANKIQHVVTQYFMTQRVKSKPAGDAAHAKYLTQITSLHSMLIHAMKAKQTIDTAHCEHLRKLVQDFSKAYFSAEDLKHIQEHHKGTGHK